MSRTRLKRIRSAAAANGRRTKHRYARDANQCERVTLAQGLTALFEQDLHPCTGTSRHTIDSYKTTFRLLLRFVEQHRPELLQPDTPVVCFDALFVDAFLRHLAEQRNCCAATINVRRAAIAALARALMHRYPQLMTYSQSLLAIRNRKTRQALVGYFEVHELEAIFNAIDTSTPDGFRNLVILRCLYNTGARASELCGLHLDDLRLDEPAYVVLHGKRGKVRTVPLWSVTADLIRAYLKSARRTPKAHNRDFLFIARRGNALTRQGLYKIAQRHLQAAARNLPRLNRKELHPVCSFRHTTATHLLMAGVSLTEIQDLLGHAHPDSTTCYRAVCLQRKRQALERLLALRAKNTQAHSSSSVHTLPAWADSHKAIEWLERL